MVPILVSSIVVLIHVKYSELVQYKLVVITDVPVVVLACIVKYSELLQYKLVALTTHNCG